MTTLTGSITQPQHLPGQYVDPETGLYQNWWRDYDPALGRYMQADPIGLAGGANLYGYAGGNPVSYIDPEGQNLILFLRIIGGGAVGAVGNVGYQLYNNGGNLACVNWWQVAEWAAFGAGIGVFNWAILPKELPKLGALASTNPQVWKQVGRKNVDAFRDFVADEFGTVGGGREKGKRFKNSDDPSSQFDEIQRAQRAVRKGKSKQIIDNIEKSEQRDKNKLKSIRVKFDPRDYDE